MGEKRLRLSARLALIGVLGVLAACSAPRIVVLDDPLTAREHVDLGLSYEVQGMTDLAEKEYRKAAARDPGWAVPYFNLGNVAYGNKDLSAAQRYFSEALERDPKNPDIMNNLALVLHETGRDTEAKALIGKALAIRHSDEYLDTLRRINESPGREETGP